MACALAAVLSGAHSRAAIGQWAKESPDALGRLGVPGRPEESTFRRVPFRLDADWFDQLAGAWTWLRCRPMNGRTVISFDGKTIRGAKTRSTRAPHLLSALVQGADAIIAQTAVDAKTNEILCLRTLSLAPRHRRLPDHRRRFPCPTRNRPADHRPTGRLHLYHKR
jgi:hypothetical protein